MNLLVDNSPDLNNSNSMYNSIASSVLDTIGNTPLIALDRLGAGLPGRVLLKLEFFNPGLAVKDRIALQIVEDAERTGRLKSGMSVIELTSGNTGTGLAIVCAVKGYPLVCVMSEGNTPERARMMRALGAEVVLVPQADGPRPGQVSGADLDAVERVTQQLTVERNAFRADQFVNRANARAHARTGSEIWRQTKGRVDAFVSTAGTGGTFAGVAQFLKRRNANVRCYLVEPATAPFLAGKPVTNPNHKLQGTGYVRDLPLVDSNLVDSYLTVGDDEAIAAARMLANREGVFAGYSTGSNVAAALRLAGEAEPGQVIVTIACDTGLKYLSTDLFE